MYFASSRYVSTNERVSHQRFNRSKTKASHSTLTAAEIKASEQYFYKAGTMEIVQFLPSKKFCSITTMKDGLLHYTGRILPGEEITIVGNFTEAMKDLSQDTFCVPVLSKDSPIAYSIASNIHWNHPVASHSGVEMTMRIIMKKVFIIEGRSLVKNSEEELKMSLSNKEIH